MTRTDTTELNMTEPNTVQRDMQQRNMQQRNMQQPTGAQTPEPADVPAGTGTVLVTGATGLVGGQLVARLTSRSDRPMVCLVRASDATHARQRGDARMAALLGRAPTREERARIEWIRGDLHDPQLGLSDADRDRLASTVDEVIHCAADVSFGASTADALRTNVDGLRRVLELAGECARSGLRRFHHVSTAYVAGRHDGPVSAARLPPDERHRFRNNYEHSKARGERVLRSQTRIPYTIYRPSIIVGDSVTGWTEAFNVLYEPMRRIVAGQLPIVPCGGAAVLDCVPVDHVADAILALAARADTEGGTYHIAAGDEAIDVTEFLAQVARGIARERGGRPPAAPRRVPRAAWVTMRRAVHAIAKRPLPLGRPPATIALADKLLRSFEPFEQYGWVGTTFECEREHDLLCRSGVQLPPAQRWFPTIVDYALANEFGRTATTEPARDEAPSRRQPMATRAAARLGAHPQPTVVAS